MAKYRERGPGYEIMSPNALYKGKSYSSLAEDWLNWYVSVDADKRNFGPVVFLRSAPIPPNGKANPSNDAPEWSTTNAFADDAFYDRPYHNLPNVRVGGEKLEIREDQAVFIPIIIAYEVQRKPYFDWGVMQEVTGLTLDYGDDPPKRAQLTIGDSKVYDEKLLKTDEDMKNFRILTSIFTVVVPEADYGRSIKDFLEVSVSPGNYPAIVEGYFVLLKFKPGYTYIVHSRASAARERGGPYVAELLYEIKVRNITKPDSVGPIPYDQGTARNRAIIKGILSEKKKKEELEPTRADKIFKTTGYQDKEEFYK